MYVNLLLPFSMDHDDPIKKELEVLAHDSTNTARGAFFTKHEIVAGILDLVDYKPSHDLINKRLLDPCTGNGEFLLEAASRLMESCRIHHDAQPSWPGNLKNCIRAVELHHQTYLETRAKLIQLLQEASIDDATAHDIADTWIRQDDFLLTPFTSEFDIIVGNPPYVRQERIPQTLLAEYKRRFSTLYDRADLYVLFYERSLNLLRPNGLLGFICANRWIKNKFGGPLRAKVSANFNLDVYIDLEQVDAFQDKVDAYPSITLIRRASPSKTRIVSSPGDGALSLSTLFNTLTNTEDHEESFIRVVEGIGSSRDPWLVNSPEVIDIVRELEQRLPTIEQAGAKVGIGVATGADSVYIGPYDTLPVEKERKLPLVMSGDLKPDGLQWGGYGLVNPWSHDGSLVCLEDYPRFANYMTMHQARLMKRHTAKKNPTRWYRTIDRVYPRLADTPKLLIPDIKGEATVIFDDGNYYPHHNLYVIISDIWDLRVLQAILKSSVALTFIGAYSVRMSGGYLRFQAQYLRRIRIPVWSSISKYHREKLLAIAPSNNQQEIDDVVFELFELSDEQADCISSFATSSRVV